MTFMTSTKFCMMSLCTDITLCCSIITSCWWAHITYYGPYYVILRNIPIISNDNMMTNTMTNTMMNMLMNTMMNTMVNTMMDMMTNTIMSTSTISIMNRITNTITNISTFTNISTIMNTIMIMNDYIASIDLLVLFILYQYQVVIEYKWPKLYV